MGHFNLGNSCIINPHLQKTYITHSLPKDCKGSPCNFCLSADLGHSLLWITRQIDTQHSAFQVTCESFIYFMKFHAMPHHQMSPLNRYLSQRSNYSLTVVFILKHLMVFPLFSKWNFQLVVENISNNSPPHGGIWEICDAVNIFISLFFTFTVCRVWTSYMWSGNSHYCFVIL